MKKSEIMVGGIYSNKPGCIYCEEREIVNMVYPRRFQIDSDCVEYKVVSGRRSGILATMTRARFAAWAKRRVDNDQD
ncbi:MAG: hypothetical protein JL50_10965 [Peptococcaceae bacterium BICA1-7]|nr:MAG: hypothetical protein JL50_10965 [Peptococcaceae bacterium BICA1-7]HBV95807.1 hypothetical protein [Desulfotomaculum sp.]